MTSVITATVGERSSYYSPLPNGRGSDVIQQWPREQRITGREWMAGVAVEFARQRRRRDVRNLIRLQPGRDGRFHILIPRAARRGQQVLIERADQNKDAVAAALK